jgi:hypothetical protein
MIDLALNSDYDLDTSGLDLKLIGSAEQVRQQLQIKLKLWRGEWFLDTEFGTPYLQQILGKQLTLSGALAAVRKSIMEVDGVRSIIDFNYSFSNTTRTLSLTFTADTPFGIVEVVS